MLIWKKHNLITMDYGYFVWLRNLERIMVRRGEVQPHDWEKYNADDIRFAYEQGARDMFVIMFLAGMLVSILIAAIWIL